MTGDACFLCPALAANRQRIVHGYGDPQARVFIVGEAPGYLGADRTGVPFTGDRSGRRVQALLIRLGLSEESDPAAAQPRLRGVFISNVVRCNPPGNRNPTPAEVANCTPFLRRDLAAVQPAAVVTLGSFAAAWAFQDLLGTAAPAGIRALHGRAWPASDLTLLTLVHPARASRAQMGLAEQAIRDLAQRDQRLAQIMAR